nr:MAG TPA: hypothetical protein [Bacteriophage sp.]
MTIILLLKSRPHLKTYLLVHNFKMDSVVLVGG